MKPSLLALSPLALAILGATSNAYAVCDPHAATYTVTTTADIVNGGDGVTSLREAIAAAEANVQCDGNSDQIEFDPSVQGQTIMLNNAININDKVRISAPSWARVTLQRTGEFSALTLGPTADVILDFLDFDGQSESQPASMLTINGNATLNNIDIYDVIASDLSSSPVVNIGESSTIVSLHRSNFTNNEGDFGMIYMGGASLLINQSNFEGNSSTKNGGVILAPTGSTLISNSTFTSNSVNDGYYGGVAMLAGGDITVDESSTFNNNTAGDGGVFYVSDLSSTLTISDTVISNNKANGTGEYGYGGAIYVNTGELALNNVEFSSNESRGGGGAIYASLQTGNTMSVSNSEFNLNTSKFGEGGAIYLGAFANLSFDFDSNEFEGNSSYYAGGAIYFISYNAATLNITDSKFIDNNSDSSNEGHVGGAIGTFCYSCDMNLNVQESAFDGNTSGNGGAIGMEGVTNANFSLVADQSSFTNNSTTQNGGAVYMDVWNGDSGSTYHFQNNHTTYSKNNALNGGAIYFNAREKISTMSMRYLTIFDNTATVEGGGIMSNGSTATTPLYLFASVLGNNHAPFYPDFSIDDHTFNIDDSVVGNANGANNASTNNWFDYNGANGTVSDIGNNGIIGAIDLTSSFEPLADNGAPGLSLYPLDNTYIIDRVVNDESVDQRGVARELDLNDRGAVEKGYKPVTVEIPKSLLILRLDEFFSLNINDYITDTGFGGELPPGYTFTATSDLPDGFTLIDGVLSGTVTQAVINSLPFNVTIDVNNSELTRTVNLTLKKPSSGGGGSLGWLFAPLLFATRFRKRK